MSSETQTETVAPQPTAVPEPKKGRIGGILRWAARLTSLPVLVMILISLIPALGTFAISPRDDKIIAISLAGAAVGLLAGWRWAGIGGGIMLVSVGVMLAQGDDWRYPDPYSVAFGLQAILFLVSWTMSGAGGKPVPAGMRWMKKATVGVLVCGALVGAASILQGPGPVPVPKDKEPFIGLWENGGGFAMEITADGHAKVTQASTAKIDPWNSPFGSGGTNELHAYFRGDEGLELMAGMFGAKKLYRIEVPPHKHGKQVEMRLNGSDPYKPGAGVTMVRKSPA